MWGKRAVDTLTCIESRGEAAATEALKGDWLGQLIGLIICQKTSLCRFSGFSMRLAMFESERMPRGSRTVRVRPGAPVPTPVTREEVGSSQRTAQRDTLRNVFRLLAQRPDPWAGIFREAHSLTDPTRRLEQLSSLTAKRVDINAEDVAWNQTGLWAARQRLRARDPKPLPRAC
jgi:hypothetical protein